MKKGQSLYKKAKSLIPGGTMLLSKRPEMHLPDQWPSYFDTAKGISVKDLDGNGTPDMLIEQDYSGRRGVWYMTERNLTEGFIFTTVAPEWQLSLQ